MITTPENLTKIRSPFSWAWIVFLIWTGVGFAVMPLGIGETDVRRWLADGMLRSAILSLLHLSDAIWILLAAVVTYFHAASAEGLATARRWALIILLGSTCFEWIGAQTGFPFGPYRYTDHFGWRIAGVLPLAIPLAWFTIIVCGRYLTLRVWPDATRLQTALGVAVAALLTDLNLEFVAWKVRGYWLWYPDAHGAVPSWPPLQNYVAWFILSFALAYVLPPNYALRLHRPLPTRPILVLALMNTLFLVVAAAYRWRSSHGPP